MNNRDKNTNTGQRVPGAPIARRSGKKPPYRLIYKPFLTALAHVLEIGAERYDEGLYDRNYQHGDDRFFLEAADHAMEHLLTYLHTEDRYYAGEDHLAHAAANLMFLVFAEDEGKIKWPLMQQETVEGLRPPDAEQFPAPEPKVRTIHDLIDRIKNMR
jgi:hypothetical protein